VEKSFFRLLLRVVGAALVLFTAGCSGTAATTERSARKHLDEVTESYRLEESTSEPTPESPLRDFLMFGILNDPAVEAAYFDWRASVERITPARSLPDPRLSFEADLTDMVMGLMPGLMFDFPGPGKLEQMGEMAAAESRAKFFAFKKELLNTAANIRNQYYRLQALEDSISINRRTLVLLDDLEAIARAQHETGKVTLQDVLRAEIEREKLLTEINNLLDSQKAVWASFRGALGTDPSGELALPKKFTNSPEQAPDEKVLERAFERNPELRRMQAEIEQAASALKLARLGVVPDFGVGLRVDVKPTPAIYKPELSMTLPVWRDKIAAEIAAAAAESSAAESRLSRERINLAIDFAAMVYMLSESSRNLKLFSEKLIPKAAQSLEIARSGYIGGRSSFIDFLEAERMLLEFELSRIEARASYENALTSVSLLIEGAAPQGAEFIDIEPKASSNSE